MAIIPGPIAPLFIFILYIESVHFGRFIDGGGKKKNNIMVIVNHGISCAGPYFFVLLFVLFFYYFCCPGVAADATKRSGVDHLVSGFQGTGRTFETRLEGATPAGTQFRPGHSGWNFGPISHLT